jgi:hypothetical protein
MRRTQNKKLSNNKLKIFFPILLFASVGSYFVYQSHAIPEGEEFGMKAAAKTLRADEVPIGSTTQAKYNIKVGPDLRDSKLNGRHRPAYMVIYTVSYDTRLFKLINGNCEWVYGCIQSTADIHNLPYNMGDYIHKKRIAICYNVPANAVHDGPAFTWTFQRVSGQPGTFAEGMWWFIPDSPHGILDGTCESNPSAVGITWQGEIGGCGESNRTCDDGTGPGAASGPLTGMGPKGNGGTGAGTNGTGTGPGPRPNPGPGGGGSSANQQGTDPTPLPTTSSQGNATQPELKPSPFFDGRDYAPGSDPLDKALGNINVGKHRILHGWLYLIGILLLIAGAIAGYFLWWRKLPMSEQVRLKNKLRSGR